MWVMSYRWVVFALVLSACGSDENGAKFSESPDETATSGGSGGTGAGGSGGSDSGSDSDGRTSSTESGGSGGTESDGPGLGIGGGDLGQGGSGAGGGAGGSGGSAGSGGQHIATMTSATSGGGASVTSTSESATASASTTGVQCECAEGDPCCDGCVLVTDGCTDVAHDVCDAALDSDDVFSCPREDWELAAYAWRCPDNEGDDGPGLGCPELGPLGDLVGEIESDVFDVKYTAKVDCVGQGQTQLRACVNFAEDEFDQCEECQ